MTEGETDDLADIIIDKLEAVTRGRQGVVLKKATTNPSPINHPHASPEISPAKRKKKAKKTRGSMGNMGEAGSRVATNEREQSKT